MRTKNLSGRELKNGFCGLAAVLMSFGLTLAIFTAAGMVLAGCDSLAGTDSSDVSPESPGIVLNSAGGPSAAADSCARKIKIKFDVRNGGWGLIGSDGIVSTQDDSRLVRDGGYFAGDYRINITIPASDRYLNIRWCGNDSVHGATYVKAKLDLNAAVDAIVFDYCGYANVNAGNLYDVQVYGNSSIDAYLDWLNAWMLAIPG